METVAPGARAAAAFGSAERRPAAIDHQFPWKPVLGLFALVAVVLSVIVGFVSNGVVRAIPFLQGPAWLDGWFQYDSGWYYNLATAGYAFVPGQQSSIAFFPTYPLAIRGLGGLLGDYQVAGSLIGVGSGIAAVVLFGFWVWDRLPRPAAVTAIAVLMLYPYALFLYGAMYADSLFLLCTLGAFVLLERRLFWLAGLAGALATAGRPVGVAVAIGLVVRMLELRALDRSRESPEMLPRVDRSLHVDTAPVRPGWREIVGAVSGIRWREAGILLSGGGALAWIGFLWLRFGHPLAFVEAESAPGWDQGVGPHTWFKVSYVEGLLAGPFTNGRLITVQAFVCLAAVLLVRRVWRRFGWGYTAYAVVVLAIPIIGTDDFMGTGRYVLVAFPVLAAAGDYLATTPRRWIRPVALAVCALLLLVMTVLYARGIEVL